MKTAKLYPPDIELCKVYDRGQRGKVIRYYHVGEGKWCTGRAHDHELFMLKADFKLLQEVLGSYTEQLRQEEINVSVFFSQYVCSRVSDMVFESSNSDLLQAVICNLSKRIIEALAEIHCEKLRNLSELLEEIASQAITRYEIIVY